MNEEKRAAAQPATDGSVEKLSLPRNIHMVPLNYISGFAVRPGLYDIYGATAIPGGVNFTVYSYGAAFSEALPDRQCVFHDRVQAEHRGV